MYFENCRAGLAEWKKSHRNLNALVERYLGIPADSENDENGLPNMKQAGIVTHPTAPKSPSDPIKEQSPSPPTAVAMVSSVEKPNPSAESQNGSEQRCHGNEPDGKEKKGNKIAKTKSNSKPKGWGDEMDELDSGMMTCDDEDQEGQSSCSKCLIYMGNIPPNAREEDVKDFFGQYVADVKDVVVTRQIIKNGKEKSLYATVKILEKDKEEVLQLNGVNVAGKQVVVEESRRPKMQRDQDAGENSDDEEEKSETVCKFYLQGRCNKPQGKCRFKHPKPCSFFANNGHCKFGDQCRFAHITKKNPNNKGQGQGDGSVALLTTFLQALGLPQFSMNKNSRNG